MKKVLILLAILFLVPVSVSAESNDYSTEKINNVENVETDETNKDTTIQGDTTTENTTTPDLIDSNVTVEDVGNRVLKKLYEIADLLKQIAAPIAIIMFIIGAILMVVGALGKKDGFKQGVIVSALSVITYVLCSYSEPIVIALSNWLAS
jgi:hypothetical protein